jgi:hypothetical protein
MGEKKTLNMGGNTVPPPLKNPKKIEIKKEKREAHIGHPRPIIPRIPPYTHGFTTETQSFLRDCGDACQASLRLHVAACGQRRCAWSPELELATAAN